jgi:ParB family chromosome partitioning protein
MPLQLDDLAALDAPVPTAGVPLMLAVDSIDEDPQQPRQEFDAATLEELAQTIRQRGVRQPISVRKSNEPSDRWVLNFGARRLRACRLAGVTEVPAFVDATADSYDQVIENEQREGLKPLEIALFVQRRLAAGDSQAEIAKRLGKSRQYVTLSTALIDPPDWLLEVYRQGRCRGMTELYALRKLHAEKPLEVETWIAEQEAVSREQIARLQERLTCESGAALQPSAAPGPALRTSVPAVQTSTETTGSNAASTSQQAFGKLSRSRKAIQVELDGMRYLLVVSTAPEQTGCMYIRPFDGGSTRLVDACTLRLLGFVDV